MKSSVSVTEIFKYVLIVTFLFAAFITLAITYNKVYRLKNETIKILEKYEGTSKKSLEIINNYLFNSAYKEKGNCESDEYGIPDLDSVNYEKVTDTKKKYYYCLKYKCIDGSCKLPPQAINNPNTSNGDEIFYNIRLFYKFNLPFVGDILTISITGETNGINYYTEKQKL